MINKILTLDNEIKVMVLDEYNYEGKNYLFISQLDNNEKLTDKFLFFEENNINNEIILSKVEDKEKLKTISEYFMQNIKH